MYGTRIADMVRSLHKRPFKSAFQQHRKNTLQDKTFFGSTVYHDQGRLGSTTDQLSNEERAGQESGLLQTQKHNVFGSTTSSVCVSQLYPSFSNNAKARSHSNQNCTGSLWHSLASWQTKLGSESCFCVQQNSFVFTNTLFKNVSCFCGVRTPFLECLRDVEHSYWVNKYQKVVDPKNVLSCRNPLLFLRCCWNALLKVRSLEYFKSGSR